jgi:hypothetical protein
MVYYVTNIITEKPSVENQSHFIAGQENLFPLLVLSPLSLYPKTTILSLLNAERKKRRREP